MIHVLIGKERPCFGGSTTKREDIHRFHRFQVYIPVFNFRINPLDLARLLRCWPISVPPWVNKTSGIPHHPLRVPSHFVSLSPEFCIVSTNPAVAATFEGLHWAQVGGGKMEDRKAFRSFIHQLLWILWPGNGIRCSNHFARLSHRDFESLDVFGPACKEDHLQFRGVRKRSAQHPP